MQTRPQICSVLIKATINHQDRWERAVAFPWRVWKCVSDFVHEHLLPLSEHSHLAGTFELSIHPPRGLFIAARDQAVNTAAPALSAAFVWTNNQEESEVDDARNDLSGLCLFTSFSHFLCLWLLVQRRPEFTTHANNPPNPPSYLEMCCIHSFSSLWPIWQTHCLLIWSPLPDKTVVFFRCSIWMMCKLARVYSHRPSFYISGAQISCLLMDKSGFKMETNKWLHK